MKFKVLYYLLIGMGLAAMPSLTQAQLIDAAESYVDFKVGNMYFNTVDGTLKEMEGQVTFDPEKLEVCSFNVCIGSKTIHTGNRKRDDHLKNEDFLDVEQYPQICFVSSSVKKRGTSYITTGRLTLLSTTKVVEIPFLLDGKWLKGELKLKRSDFSFAEDYGTFLVSDEIRLMIYCKLK